jgi:GTPase SAR1 family protein
LQSRKKSLDERDIFVNPRHDFAAQNCERLSRPILFKILLRRRKTRRMLSWLTGQGSTGSQPPAPTIVEDWPKVRILVLGDSGVGKSCLTERLVTGKPSSSTPRWTLGCDVSVMVHTLAAQTERKVLIEFWDVGGHRNYADSRSVFYHQINGVFLVHDSSNRKSFNHLKSWLEELEKEDQSRKLRGLTGIEEPRFGVVGKSRETSDGVGAYRMANPPQHHHRKTTTVSNSGPLDGIPILIVGNKCDSGRVAAVPPKMWTFDSVLTSATAPSRDGRPIIDQDKFMAFFEKVYERRYGS